MAVKHRGKDQEYYKKQKEWDDHLEESASWDRSNHKSYGRLNRTEKQKAEEREEFFKHVEKLEDTIKRLTKQKAAATTPQQKEIIAQKLIKAKKQYRKLELDDAQRLQSYRSWRSINKDGKTRSKQVVKDWRWMQNPGKYDYEGVDTPNASRNEYLEQRKRLEEDERVKNVQIKKNRQIARKSNRKEYFGFYHADSSYEHQTNVNQIHKNIDAHFKALIDKWEEARQNIPDVQQRNRTQQERHNLFVAKEQFKDIVNYATNTKEIEKEYKEYMERAATIKKNTAYYKEKFKPLPLRKRDLVLDKKSNFYEVHRKSELLLRIPDFESAFYTFNNYYGSPERAKLKEDWKKQEKQLNNLTKKGKIVATKTSHLSYVSTSLIELRKLGDETYHAADLGHRDDYYRLKKDLNEKMTKLNGKMNIFMEEQYGSNYAKELA